MSRKVPPAERLAREICWREFSEETRRIKRKIGETPISYWGYLDDWAKRGYIQTAEEIIFWMRRLGHEQVALYLEGNPKSRYVKS